MFFHKTLLAAAFLASLTLLPSAHAQESAPAFQLNTEAGVIACQNGLPTLTVKPELGGHIIPVVPTISYKSSSLEMTTVNERGHQLTLNNEGGMPEFGFTIVWGNNADRTDADNGALSMSFIAANKVCGG